MYQEDRFSHKFILEKIVGIIFLLLIIMLYIYLLLSSGYHFGSKSQLVNHDIIEVPDTYQIIPFASDSILEQEFKPDYSFLKGISLVVVDIPYSRNGAVRFTLLDSEGAILQERSVYLNDIEAGAFYNVNFNCSVVTGEVYILRMELMDLQSDGIQVICATQEELLPETGTLKVNGVKADVSLVSSYYYEDNAFSIQKFQSNIVMFIFLNFINLLLLIAPICVSINLLSKKRKG